MVCPRCVSAVKETLDELKIPYKGVILGKAIIYSENITIDYDLLNRSLQKIGFELLQDKHQQLVEQIKILIVNFIHNHKAEDLNINFSDYLSQQTDYDYTYLSKTFSEKEGLTIEKYIILQKIEKVKELIDYNELNFSEIAFQLNYSSAAHLSKQFKKITGYTLSQYKKNKPASRLPIDAVHQKNSKSK
jgi:AraC-like DNA-binding protein